MNLKIGKAGRTITTPIKLWNTLSRSKETVHPNDTDIVTVYACGPTVYDYQHIGNYRTFLMVDLLHRVLRVAETKTELAINITDVGHLTSDQDEGEDKIEAKAKREHQSVQDIARLYEQSFWEDCQNLSILRPTYAPRATEHIQDMITLIEKIEKNGFTYKTSDGIYFDTSKDPGYTKLAQLNLAGQTTSDREIVKTDKRQPADFALWKFANKDSDRQMVWDSPWGKGFPGWHIECSAMSVKYLGQPITIHTGGVDHIPVHHTNEIAQTWAATGKPLAQIFVHVEHLLVNGKKMAKSAGTFIRPADIIEKGYQLRSFRYLVLTAHYQEKLNFTWESLDSATRALSRIDRLIGEEGHPDPAAYQAGLELVADNLASPALLAYLEKQNNPWLWREFDPILGLDLVPKEGITLTENQQELVAKRNDLRAHSEFEQADQIRKQLLEQGIVLDDTSGGTVAKKSV